MSCYKYYGDSSIEVKLEGKLHEKKKLDLSNKSELSIKACSVKVAKMSLFFPPTEKMSVILLGTT